MTENGKLNAQKYRDDIIAQVVLPFMNAGNCMSMLQQDHARPNTARATTQILTVNNVNVMERPSMSPDLAPIEHIWEELDGSVRASLNQPANAQPWRAGQITGVA